VFDVLSAFGLASAAGLNAYMPLLVVSLAARYNLLQLQAPFDVMGSPWVIGVLAVLVVVEFVADKVPTVDHVWHLLGLAIHPIAGAILFASQAQVITEVNPVLSLICGLVLAGGVHGVRAGVRPVVTATTAGLGNPVVSLIEDVAAIALSVLSLIVPILAVLVAVVVVVLAVLLLRRRRSPAGVVRRR
jgi:uncharacterized membrane protein